MAPKRRPFAFVDPALQWMLERGVAPPEDQRKSSDLPVIHPPLMTPKPRCVVPVAVEVVSAWVP